MSMNNEREGNEEAWKSLSGSSFIALAGCVTPAIQTNAVTKDTESVFTDRQLVQSTWLDISTLRLEWR